MANEKTDNLEPGQGSPDEAEIISMDVHKHGEDPAYASGQTKAELQQLPASEISTLSEEQIKATRAEQIQALTEEQVQALVPTQLQVLNKEQFQALRPTQLNALSPAQLEALTPKQIHAVDIHQIREPSGAVHRWVALLPPQLQQKLGKRLSFLIIAGYTASTQPRPQAHSLWSASPNPTECADYTSWPSLTDRSFSVRHLPPWPAEKTSQLPPDSKYVSPDNFGQITDLFRRGDNWKPSRSSVLFMFFAQWLTDSFLRTDPTDRRKNTSNHQIDMCQVYGLKEATTHMLRTHEGGRLRSQTTDEGDEYLPFLFDDKGNVKVEFQDLPYVRDGRYKEFLSRFADPYPRKEGYFATGLERGNSTFGYSALSTLFLREHNRLCKGLKENETQIAWGDERLFQTARLIVIALELKIVIEEYVNHIADKADGNRPFVFDHSYAEQERWYRTNWIAIEFDLLYRWHSLVPDTLSLGGDEPMDYKKFLVNNKPLLRHGVGGILRSATTQPAGQIGLFNTPNFLLAAEYEAIKMSRDYRLQPYSEYCKRFTTQAPGSFSDINSNTEIQDKLRDKYGSVDNVEFLVGLYAQEPKPGKLFGELMTRMVAYDAFTHALTNPLLSTHIFTRETLTDYGWDQITQTGSLNDILERNDDHEPPEPVAQQIPISMDSQ